MLCGLKYNVLFCDDKYVGVVYMPPECSRYAMAKDILRVLAEDIFSLSVNGHVLLYSYVGILMPELGFYQIFI